MVFVIFLSIIQKLLKGKYCFLKANAVKRGFGWFGFGCFFFTHILLNSKGFKR